MKTENLGERYNIKESNTQKLAETSVRQPHHNPDLLLTKYAHVDWGKKENVIHGILHLT